MRQLDYYIEKSLSEKNTRSLECDLTLRTDDTKYHAYEVSIAHRDLLFYTDKGTLNYVIDSYGDRHTAELYSIDSDEAV